MSCHSALSLQLNEKPSSKTMRGIRKRVLSDCDNGSIKGTLGGENIMFILLHVYQWELYIPRVIIFPFLKERAPNKIPPKR